MAFPAIAAVAAPLLAGFLGQERANRQNLAEARRNRAFQAEQADANRAFQERMRNTSWQAGIADMEAAGLNPALALSQGGASSPSGSMGSGSQSASIESVTSSALQAAQMKETLGLLSQQRRKAKAEADVESERADYLTRREAATVNGRRFKLAPRLYDLLDSELDTAKAGATNMSALADRNRELARIAAPMGDLSERMGELLPILGLVTGAGGPASSLIRAIKSRGKRLRR